MLALPISPFLRYNPKLPRRAVEPRELSVCSNTEIVDGNVRKSDGFTALESLTLDGPARHIREHVINDGTRFLCILTINKFWVYNTGSATLTDCTRVGEAYSGSFQWSSCSYGDYFIFSNGVNEVQKWDGGVATPQPAVNLITNAADNAYAVRPMLVMTYGTHLLLVNDQAAGDRAERKAIWWSVPAFPEDFTSAGYGKLYAYEGVGEIKAIRGLTRDTIAVYKSDIIHLFEYVGGTTYFTLRVGIPGIGVDSRDAVAQIGNDHIVLTNNGLRKFDGSTVAPFAPEIDPIFVQYYPNNNSKYAQLVYDGYNNKLWVFLPKAGASWEAESAIVYSFRDASWSRQSGFSTYAVCTANISTSTGTRWMDLPVGWGDPTVDDLFWGAQNVAARYRVVVGDSVNAVYQEDSLSNTRNGAVYQATAETVMINPGFILFQHPTTNVEIVQVDMGIWSGNPDVFIGTSDRGDETITWHGPYTPDANGRVYKTIVGRWFIFRLQDVDQFSAYAITPWFVKRGVV